MNLIGQELERVNQSMFSIVMVSLVSFGKLNCVCGCLCNTYF